MWSPMRRDGNWLLQGDAGGLRRTSRLVRQDNLVRLHASDPERPSCYSRWRLERL